MIGVIADDLTGAAEIGGIGLRHGLRAEIIFSGPASGTADLVCIDTDSRSCPAKEAARRAAGAADSLVKAGANWIYKKVDSVLRGNVTPEIEAIMESLNMKLAFLAPGNPSSGRIIRNGRYFVRDKPINETEFARDPEHPRNSAGIRELLHVGRELPLHVCRARDPLPDSGVVVCEAETLEDVKAWATRLNPATFAAGAGEFFGAVLVAKGHSATHSIADVPVVVRSPVLFVSGSTSESARGFIAAAASAGTPVFSLPEDLARGADFAPAALDALAMEAMAALQNHSCVILNVGLPPVVDRSIARRLSGHLVQLAAAVLGRVNVGHVYAEGGATAVELAGRMGWDRLSVVREIARGTATLAVGGENAPLLTMKPGSYVWPEEIRKFALCQT